VEEIWTIMQQCITFCNQKGRKYERKLRIKGAGAKNTKCAIKEV